MPALHPEGVALAVEVRAGLPAPRALKVSERHSSIVVFARVTPRKHRGGRSARRVRLERGEARVCLPKRHDDVGFKSSSSCFFSVTAIRRQGAGKKRARGAGPAAMCSGQSTGKAQARRSVTQLTQQQEARRARRPC
jgi:hypothetical protein